MFEEEFKIFKEVGKSLQEFKYEGRDIGDIEFFITNNECRLWRAKVKMVREAKEQRMYDTKFKF